MHNELTLSEENDLSNAIVALHPHKALLDAIEPKVYFIRKGWPSCLRFAKKQREVGR